MELNEQMEFDHVIRVHPDGTITDEPNIDGPDVCLNMDAEGQCLPEADDNMIAMAERQGWELLTGFTGQYSYNGPTMHPSEFIGGNLERHIRETPGYYVALSAECLRPDGLDEEPAGWLVAYREETQ